jgi:hypothetical protein
MAKAPVTPGDRPWLPALLVLAGWLLVAWGYWGPWLWSDSVGLRVLGLDLAEYVKFVHEVRTGQVRLVRELFYLPLIGLSLSMSIVAHREEFRVPTALRWTLNLLAIPAALAMLPPAWTPSLLWTPEFSKQTVAILACVGAALLAYPVLRRLPMRVAATLVIGLAMAAAVPPIVAFFRLRPALDIIYGRPIIVGYGIWRMALGWILICVGIVLASQAREKSVP